MVENGKEIIKQSTFTHMRAHIRVPDYILSPSRRPCLSHLPNNSLLHLIHFASGLLSLFLVATVTFSLSLLFSLPSPFFSLPFDLFWPPSVPLSPSTLLFSPPTLPFSLQGYSKTKSGPGAQFRTYSGPFLALWSGSGPSPEFRTFVVPLHKSIFFKQC